MVVETSATTSLAAGSTKACNLPPKPTSSPLCFQVMVVESPQRVAGSGSKFKVIGIVVHDAPFSAHLPFLGSQQPDHEEYVEAKLGGKLPGGFA